MGDESEPWLCSHGHYRGQDCDECAPMTAPPEPIEYSWRCSVCQATGTGFTKDEHSCFHPERMTDLPDAETAWEAWSEGSERRWSFTRRETKDAFKAGFAAASGPWADLAAALARNAELEERLRETNEDADSLDERLTQASRDCLKLRTERNEARELLADVEDRVARNQPWMPSYVGAMKRLRKATADNLALRAELDNLRKTLAQKIEKHMRSEQIRVPEYETGLRRAAAIVRGSDDEAGSCTCGESVPTVTTPGPCYWAENAPGVQSQVHCPPPPDGVAR